MKLNEQSRIDILSLIAACSLGYRGDPASAILLIFCLAASGWNQYLKHKETLREVKERSALEQLQERLTKIELGLGLKHNPLKNAPK